MSQERELGRNIKMSCITKVVPGTDGNYFADEDGNVYSVCRSNSKGGQLKPGKSKGYFIVNINSKTRTIHRVIAKLFVPNPLNLKYVNHKNGIKTDNRKINLEWCTCSYNILHSYRVLNRAPNINFPNKLTEADVYELKKHMENNGTRKEFAELKNVSCGTIDYILIGKNWKRLNIDWTVFKHNRKRVPNEIATQIRSDRLSGMKRNEILSKYDLPLATIKYILSNISN